MPDSRRPRSPSSRRSVAGNGFQLSDESDTLKYPVHEYLRDAVEKQREKEVKRIEPTNLPLLVGVFEFPWHVQTLNCWIPMSLLFLLAGGMLAFLFSYGLQAGFIGIRTVGLSACVMTIIAAGYACACFMAVIDETADGRVDVAQWPGALQWKDWAWGLVFILTMVLESALGAFILTCWLTPWTVIPSVLLTFAFFPIVFLASSVAGAWAPVSKEIFQSLITRFPLWALFYAEYFAVLFLWSLVSGVAAFLIGWWALLLVCPLLAAALLIEARLLGRVAWCIGKAG